MLGSFQMRQVHGGGNRSVEWLVMRGSTQPSSSGSASLFVPLSAILALPFSAFPSPSVAVWGCKGRRRHGWRDNAGRPPGGGQGEGGGAFPAPSLSRREAVGCLPSRARTAVGFGTVRSLCAARRFSSVCVIT